MTKQFNIFFNKILLELSQNLVQRAVNDNQSLARRNKYAKDRSERFYKKAINYAEENNSAIKLNVIGEGKIQIINFIITKIKNPDIYGGETGIRSEDWRKNSLQIYGNIRNLEDFDKYDVHSDSGRLLLFNLNSYEFYDDTLNQNNSKVYILVDKKDALIFKKKVEEQTGIQIPWKSLRFGDI